ncbi:MAG: hypothetical protein FWE57_00820 [Chitinispirillia bacterium]|nr:hypothetical protein [Chitinispirillia bacterium]
MPKRMFTLPALCALCFVFAVSCGSSFRHIQVRTVSEAEQLQAEAAAKNLQGEEIKRADGFLARAKTTKSQQESAELADQASAWYRVALARQSVEESANALKRAEAALRASKEQVNRYQDIFSGINTSAGGQ